MAWPAAWGRSLCLLPPFFKFPSCTWSPSYALSFGTWMSHNLCQVGSSNLGLCSSRCSLYSKNLNLTPFQVPPALILPQFLYHIFLLVFCRFRLRTPRSLSSVSFTIVFSKGAHRQNLWIPLPSVLSIITLGVCVVRTWGPTSIFGIIMQLVFKFVLEVYNEWILAHTVLGRREDE